MCRAKPPSRVTSTRPDSALAAQRREFRLRMLQVLVRAAGVRGIGPIDGFTYVGLVSALDGVALELMEGNVPRLRGTGATGMLHAPRSPSSRSSRTAFTARRIRASSNGQGGDGLYPAAPACETFEPSTSTRPLKWRTSRWRPSVATETWRIIVQVSGLRPAVGGNETGASFELCVPRDGSSSSTSILPMVRRFVRELCMRTLFDPDVTTRVVVASHELLDNAVRHGERDGSSIRVSIARTASEADVVIDTSNFVDALRASALREFLAMLAREGASPHYACALQRIASSPVETAMPGGLGLGRVQAEAAFVLSCRFEDEMAHVRARGRFPLRGDTVKGR